MTDENFFSDDDATLDGLDEGELRALEEEAFGTAQQVLQIRQQQQLLPQQQQQPPQKQHLHQQQQQERSNSHSSRRPATSYARGPQAPFKPPRPSALGSGPTAAYTKPQGYSQQLQNQPRQHQAVVQQQQQHEQHRELLRPCRQAFEEEPTLPVAAATAAAAAAAATAAVPETFSSGNNPEKPSSDYGDIEGFEETVELWDTPAPAVIGAGGEAREYPVVGGGADIYLPTQHQRRHQQGEGGEWIGQQQQEGTRQVVGGVVAGSGVNDWPAAVAANPAADAEREAFRLQAAEVCKQSSMNE